MIDSREEWQRICSFARADTEYKQIVNQLIRMDAGEIELHNCRVKKVEYGCHPCGGRHGGVLAYVVPTFYVDNGEFHAGGFPHKDDPLDFYYAANRINSRRLK